jgi:sulfotransferase famil protein
MRAKPAANRRLLRYPRLSLESLADNAAHQFAAEHALAIYAADAVYSFIPKNACSTLRYSIALANGAIAGASDFNWIHANNLTFRATLAELATAKYTFAILRDPYLRLGSCYLDKIVDQTNIGWQYHMLTAYKTPPAALTFRQFVAGLRGQLQADQHWRPQLDFLVYEHYDDFFCLENFAEAVATLRRRIGLEVRDARGLTKHGTDQFEPLPGDEPFADTPACDIAALKRAGHIPRITQLYDPPLIAEVERLYRKDIRFYTQTTGRPAAFS